MGNVLYDGDVLYFVEFSHAWGYVLYGGLCIILGETFIRWGYVYIY